MLHPDEKPRVPYVSQCLADAPGVLVAASDYLKVLPTSISKWMPRRLCRSAPMVLAAVKAGRHCADFFEVDARFIVLATLTELLREGKFKRQSLRKPRKILELMWKRRTREFRRPVF